MTHQQNSQPVFAAISDENGILEFAGQHRDLADAIIAYAKDVSMPISADNQANGITWYEFETPPAGWEDWHGGMSGDDYDAMVSAGTEETRGWIACAVREALLRVTAPTESDLYDEGIGILDAATVGDLAIYDDGFGLHCIADAAEVMALARGGDYAAWCRQRRQTHRESDGYTTHEEAIRAAHQITNTAARAART